jgi:adenylate cyclase
VKNIPTPVHAYMVAMRREDGSYSTPQFKRPAKPSTAPHWIWPVTVAVIAVAAIGVGGFLYFTKIELGAGPKQDAGKLAASAPPPSSTPAPAPTLAKTALTPSPSSSPPSPPNERFVAETVPFVADRARLALANEYVPAADYKAFALNINGINAFVLGQPNEDAAKSAAIELCQKRADDAKFPRKCELYALGNRIVYPHGMPPVPPLPWVTHDPATERAFKTDDIPLLREQSKTRLENVYVPGRRTRSLAIGPGGQFFYNFNMDTVQESARRNLESCGGFAGVPCMIVAVDDVFVVPVPTTLRALGFFRAATSPVIAPEARNDVARRLADAASGWNAVAVGTAGRPGLGLKAQSEQDAVNAALGDCVKRDSECHVIAIGPFSVGPN